MTLARYRLGLVAFVLSLCCQVAQSQMLQDPAWDTLYRSERNALLQRAATEHLARQPDAAQAVLGLALAALAQDEAAPRLEALRHAEGCVQRQPQSAPCHYALGVVLGVQAISEGMWKAARSAGSVRQALGAAQGLAPAWYAARSALVEFYLVAPGFMGGDAARAAELARTAPTSEQGRALEARIALNARQHDIALQHLSVLPAALPSDLAADVRAWTLQAAFGLLQAGQPDRARPALERLQREYPALTGPTYALGRLRAELGEQEEALKLYRQAAELQGAEHWPVAYRMGIAYQTLGRNGDASAALQRFVATGKGQKASLDDARKRLQQLRG
jgi:tetratricopeptide (TPR) repeat protein